MKYLQQTIKFLLLFIASSTMLAQNTQSEETIKTINVSLDQWHQSAAQADFDSYFGLMTEDAVFIGTDPTENWQLDAFKAFAKPYFDKGKAWSFSKLERTIYLGKNTHYAWFDELLTTQMGICRGSGVVEATKTGWKIKHYVLSITVPNENVSEVTKMKQKFEDKFIQQLKSN
ncbi:nuclear transport factor 2 family protein [Aquimarina intermedia]|uniref:SnoaL-like protein n=1 Tax=Aquimarina intermedia TaxID=350814 RepID=A0A5S5C9X9_9FLAO|nr:nuclear transport factor 2 family protein [Aquimarina intermedia]TYP76211.1 SnoaL-like protein [Aquimarina intermedia]